MKPVTYKLYVIDSDPIVSLSSEGWSLDKKTTVDEEWNIDYVCKIARNYKRLDISINLHSFYMTCTKEEVALLTSSFQYITVKPNSIDKKWVELLLDSSSPSYCLKTLLFQFSISPLHSEPSNSTTVYIEKYIEKNYKIQSVEVCVGNTHVCSDEIKKILNRNRNCVERCQKACLYLIASRKYKECDLVHLPKEIVKMISLEIWKTRNESIWVEK